MRRKVLLIGANGFVGQIIAESLKDNIQMIQTAGHHKPEDGYQLAKQKS